MKRSAAAEAPGAEQGDEVFPLLLLPKDLIVSMLAFCQPAQLFALAQCCRLLSALSSDSALWLAQLVRNVRAPTVLVLDDLPLLPEPEGPGGAALLNWKQVFLSATRVPSAQEALESISAMPRAVLLVPDGEHALREPDALSEGDLLIQALGDAATFVCLGGPALVITSLGTVVVRGIRFDYRAVDTDEERFAKACIFMPAMLASELASPSLLVVGCSFTSSTELQNISGIGLESRTLMPLMRNYLMGHVPPSDEPTDMVAEADTSLRLRVLGCTFSNLAFGFCTTSPLGGIPGAPHGASAEFVRSKFTNISDCAIYQSSHGVIRIDDCAFQASCAISLRGVDEAIISNVRAVGSSDRPCVWILQNSKLLMDNCHLSGGTEGLVLEGVGSVTVSGSTVSDCRSAGVVLYEQGRGGWDSTEAKDDEPEPDEFPQYLDPAELARGVLENAVFTGVPGVNLDMIERVTGFSMDEQNPHLLHVALDDDHVVTIPIQQERTGVSDVVFSRPPPPPRGSPIRFVNCAFRGNSLSNVTVETTSPVFLDRCTLRSSTIGVEVRRTNVVREQANVTVTKCVIERNEIGALLGDGSRIHLDRTAITSHSKCGVRVTFGGELGTTECTWGSNSAADVLLVHAPGEAEPPALLVVREELEKANAGIVVRLEQATTRALRLADFSSDDAFIAEVLLESNRTGRCTRAWTGLSFFVQPMYECFTCDITAAHNSGLCAACRKEHVRDGHRVSAEPTPPLQGCFCDCSTCDVFNT